MGCLKMSVSKDLLAGTPKGISKEDFPTSVSEEEISRRQSLKMSEEDLLGRISQGGLLKGRSLRGIKGKTFEGRSLKEISKGISKREFLVCL